MDSKYSSAEYKRSRISYAVQCTLEHLLGLLVLDAFLAKLLTYMGLSDALTGIVTTFSSVAFVFQLLSIKLVQSRFSTKKMVIFFDVLSQGFFMLLYFVPFVNIDAQAKKLFVVVGIMIGQAGKCVISTLYFKWANTYVSPKRRAIYSAKKEMISLICGIIFSLVMGWIIDWFEDISNIRGGFLFIGSSMLIINIANFISLLLIKDEEKTARLEMRVPLKEVINHYFTNKLYLRYVLTGFVRSIGGNMIFGFIGVYKTNDLGFSILTLQIINILADFVRMAVSTPFAKFSQKYGYIKGMELAAFINVLGYILIVFTTPDSKWLIIVYTFLYAISLAGTIQNSFNVNYTLLPQKYMTQVSSITQTISGIISLLAAILGGRLLSFVQQNGNTVFGVKIYGQQLLALIAVIIILISIILRYIFVVKPLDKKEKL